MINLQVEYIPSFAGSTRPLFSWHMWQVTHTHTHIYSHTLTVTHILTHTQSHSQSVIYIHTSNSLTHVFLHIPKLMVRKFDQPSTASTDHMESLVQLTRHTQEGKETHTYILTYNSMGQCRKRQKVYLYTRSKHISQVDWFFGHASVLQLAILHFPLSFLPASIQLPSVSHYCRVLSSCVSPLCAFSLSFTLSFFTWFHSHFVASGRALDSAVRDCLSQLWRALLLSSNKSKLLSICVVKKSCPLTQLQLN